MWSGLRLTSSFLLDIVLDITVPKTRWSYNAERLHRIYYLYPYASIMESQTASTAQQRTDWANKKAACSESLISLKPALPIFKRFHRWIVYFQNSTTPTIGLLLFAIDDLIAVCEDLANAADANGFEEAEIVLSRIQAELNADFELDLRDDYLKLAQLFDPRVCTRTGSITEVDRLLRLACDLISLDIGVDHVEADVDDIFNEPPITNHASECAAFKAHMRKVRVKLVDADGVGGLATYKYFGGVERQLDIDVLAFYRPILDSIPKLAVVIRKILANQVATSTAERSFNISGNVLSIRRCSLDPGRAEKLIVSAFRHRCKLRSEKKPPRVPSFRVLEEEDVEEEEDEDDVRERQEIETVAWAAFFDDD